jgi:hypothetical protein
MPIRMWVDVRAYALSSMCDVGSEVRLSVAFAFDSSRWRGMCRPLTFLRGEHRRWAGRYRRRAQKLHRLNTSDGRTMFEESLVCATVWCFVLGSRRYRRVCRQKRRFKYLDCDVQSCKKSRTNQKRTATRANTSYSLGVSSYAPRSQNAHRQ